ncbi:MAG: hypothetical protein NVSMB13_01360 [Mycobacteriales bacterium]
MSRVPEVLFVCVHNAGRSQMAAAFLASYARGRVAVRSAGSVPADEVNPAVVEVMREVGLEIGAELPKRLTDGAVRAADVVITMGCGDACPVFPGKRYLDWSLDDPAGLSVGDIRPIRDEIDRQVRGLLAELVGFVIAPLTPGHSDAVLAIYQAGIDSGNATFETVAPSWPSWDDAHLPSHRFVALDPAGVVLGWVAASPVSSRCVYAGVLECSVYAAPGAQGRGVGRALMAALIDSTEAAGIWTLEAGIFPENTASLALHKAVGFRVVGTRERIGQQHGRWRDTLLLERRRA